ncbi:MAG: TraB/GumN family protein [Steroidobacteraceae bacterium]|nr:TraB/GumN family protein [Steroidobacteraceae bacterium]
MTRVQNYRPRLLLALAALLLPFGIASADPTVWAVSGKNNTVYLFGSVHLLPEGGFAIEGELERAYRDAERVCLEVDIGALTPATTLSITLARAIDPEGRGLYDLLGASAARVREAAASAGFDLAQYEPFEPWFVGISVSVMALQQHGYVADHGVEQVIEQAAKQDGKPGCGLETLDEQLALLDNMPAEEQLEVLLQSLEESKEIEREMKGLFDAWQDGDDEPLIRQLDEEFADYPDLAERLIYARNERWADQVAKLLEQPDDVLVVVGALHLVGKQGLPAKLKRRGFRIERR